MIVRPEAPGDHAAIRDVNVAAFLHHPFSQQTEHLIVEALREAGSLEVSLVAVVDETVAGHIAFSGASIGETPPSWYLLGPVAVLPDHQGQGIGRALIESGLAVLRSRGAAGCVLVGDPAFYRRFGFRRHDGVTWARVPDENVLCLVMSGEPPSGEVLYHPAFSVGV